MKSVQVILDGQDASGSYVASPTFSQYGYAWLRDGAFCALAMHRIGEIESADKFNSWVAQLVNRNENLFSHACRLLKEGTVLLPEECPPTRFHMDGSLEPDHHEVWPNYQLDGYETWLSVVNQLNQPVNGLLLKAVRIVADFLLVAWPHPCFDCWEEGGDLLHGSTLISIAGGLKAAYKITGDLQYRNGYDQVMEGIRRDFVVNGHLVKQSGAPQIDASLAWAAIPHDAVENSDPLIRRTIEEIKLQLRASPGGVKRYLGDSYYGGGDWVLLEGLLACDAAREGDKVFWSNSCAWIREIAGVSLLLPEQVLFSVQAPNMIAPWRERWGEVANPLLWSHAMFLLALYEGAEQKWI